MAPLFKNKTAEPFAVTMPYSEAEQNAAVKLSTHVGQELDIVVSGAMKVQDVYKRQLRPFPAVKRPVFDTSS